MGYPGRHNIYEATIRRMVTEALEQQEQEFRQEHQEDTDAQLLAYLQACAKQLHHSPWPDEIVGGSFLQERFGSWSRALFLAGLPGPRTPKQNKTNVRFQTEVEKQKEIYRQRKAVRKALAAQKRMQQESRRKHPD